MGRRDLPRLILALLSLGVVVSVLGGCLSVKSYVDPELPKVGYGDLLVRRESRPVGLALEFQRNGKTHDGLSPRVREQAKTILERTKLFTEVADAGQADQLRIVLNNVSDVGDAVGKGIKTGLTFGGVGSLVTDGYVLTATWVRVGQTPVTKTYRHALHSTIGNAEGPKGLSPLRLQEAFDKVLEELVLNLILDLQKEERL